MHLFYDLFFPIIRSEHRLLIKYQIQKTGGVPYEKHVQTHL